MCLIGLDWIGLDWIGLDWILCFRLEADVEVIPQTWNFIFERARPFFLLQRAPTFKGAPRPRLGATEGKASMA